MIVAMIFLGGGGGGATLCQSEGTHQIVMSFTPPFLGCLLKMSLQKGGHGYPRTSPSYTRKQNEQTKRANEWTKDGRIGCASKRTNGEQMNERNEMKSHEKGETKRMEEQREPNGEGS